MKKYIYILIGLISVTGGIIFFIFSLPKSSQVVLRVMTYSSFAGVFGPGAEIKKEFEKQCQCQLKWIRVSDSTLFAQRLSLRKDGFQTDVVMGMDQISLVTMIGGKTQSGRYLKELPWEKVNISRDIFVSPAVQFFSESFVPYNWSPMTFIARKKLNPFHLHELLQEKYKNNISLPSPRTSTVGLQFYYWVWLTLQDQSSKFLKAFRNQLYGLPPSWSTSYALFQRGHVDLSFSYFSSLLYHKSRNQEDFYEVLFTEGHPFQVELAAVSGFCSQCELARTFVSFLLKPEIQDILLKKNYMFPVVKGVSHSGIPTLNFISYDQLPLFFNKMEEWIHLWD